MDDNRGQVPVRDNPSSNRYEVREDGHTAVLTYERSDGHIAFNHTVVPHAIEGHGIAGRLAHVALEDARHDGLTVIPRCPFVAAYIRRHPEYADLVTPEDQARYLNAPSAP